MKESQKNITSIENILATKNLSSGSLVNINVNCCGCGCNNSNNSNNTNNTNPPGGLPNNQTNCTDPNNVLISGKSYEFSNTHLSIKNIQNFI